MIDSLLNYLIGVWHLLRMRLAETEPTKFETREVFLVRLRRAVKWLNTNRSEALLDMCTNQKARARDVIGLGGARSRW